MIELDNLMWKSMGPDQYSQITEQQGRDLHHYFIDITGGNRADLVSVRDEPVERARFQKALQEHGPFQPPGCPSAFAEAAQTIAAALTKVKNKQSLTIADRDLILNKRGN